MSKISKIIKMTVPETGDADWLSSLESAFTTIKDKFDNVMSMPSGIPEGTPAGRIVCVGPGTGGQPTLFLAFANPPIGNEYRRRPFGVTLEKAPALDEDIKVHTLGFTGYDHKYAPSRTLPNPGGPGDTVIQQPLLYGKPAYLKDGDIADPTTLGLLTEDEADSTGYNDEPVIVGVFLPLNNLLLRPRIQVEA